jgi:hypothetical protein
MMRNTGSGPCSVDSMNRHILDFEVRRVNVSFFLEEKIQKTYKGRRCWMPSNSFFLKKFGILFLRGLPIVTISS